MSDKPKSTGAGAILRESFANSSGEWIDRSNLAANAVIEWHEAQREKVGETWEVRSYNRDGIAHWVLATYQTRDYAMVRKHNECVAKDYAVTVVHVTRYRKVKR